MADIDLNEFYARQDGFPQRFERAYNARRDRTLKGAWETFGQLAFSSFGKGVLVAAATVLVAGALLMGGLVSTGALSYASEGAVQGFGPAAMRGLSMATEFLTSAPGLLALGAAGTVNAVASVRAENRALQEEFQIAAYRREKHAQTQAHEQQMLMDAPQEAKGAFIDHAGKRGDVQSFVVKEMQRRADQQRGGQDVQL